jgi:hypothetical protein
MRAEHDSDRKCVQCGHDVTADEVIAALDTSSFDDALISPAINCANCSGYNTGIEHNELHICTECLTAETTIQFCEWCGEGQIGGGDLEDSYHLGCEFCDGRAGSMKDD